MGLWHSTCRKKQRWEETDSCCTTVLPELKSPKILSQRLGTSKVDALRMRGKILKKEKHGASRKEKDLAVGSTGRTLEAAKDPGSCCSREILHILENTVEVHQLLNFLPSHWIIVLLQSAWWSKESVPKVGGSPEGWSDASPNLWMSSSSLSRGMLIQMKWQQATHVQLLLKTRRGSYRT